MAHRAIITGVAGFLGGFLAEHLLDCGDAVLGCSRDGMWKPYAPSTLKSRVPIVAWDVGSPSGLSKAAQRELEDFRPDHVYHLAALSIPVDCGQEEPLPRATAVNVDGTRRVMRWAASLSPRPRVIFASTCQVYAPVTPETPLIDELAPVGPTRAYGQTKLAAETEVRRAIEQHGCDAIIIRSFQHTGPRQDGRIMLPQWAKQFATGGTGPVEVYSRDAYLDLTDGRDAARAYRLLAERGRSAEVYNVGSGIARRSGEVLDMLRAMADSERPIVELRPGFKQDPIADISRLVELTGWRPTIPLETTVRDTLDWWREQAD